MAKTEKLLSLVSTLLILGAAFWAVRFAAADILIRYSAASRAVAMLPFDASYQARAGNLRRAVELNPYLSSAWQDLGLNAESAGDLREAERCLLKSAEVDKTFLPRWSLANFYFRQGRKDPFWHWLRLAAERSYGDRTAIFRLGWRMAEGELPDGALPVNAAVLSDYLQFLLREKQFDAAQRTAERLLPLASATEKSVLLEACHRMMAMGRVDHAVSIWNGLSSGGLLPHRPLNLMKGSLLINGDLASEPCNCGFDWRLLWRAGVHTSYSPQRRELRATLLGKQEERTELLEQFLPLTPGTYLFRYRYRSEALIERSGLRWLVEAVPGGAALAVSRKDLSSSDWREETLSIPVAAPMLMVRLVLVYQRGQGTVRQAGTILFSGAFSLTPTS